MDGLGTEFAGGIQWLLRRVLCLLLATGEVSSFLLAFLLFFFLLFFLFLLHLLAICLLKGSFGG